VSGRTRLQPSAGISRVNPPIILFIKNFIDQQIGKNFKLPSVTGRFFFRLLSQGQAAPIQNQKFLDATL
jgi:hypothetical protein